MIWKFAIVQTIIRQLRSELTIISTTKSILFKAKNTLYCHYTKYGDWELTCLAY